MKKNKIFIILFIILISITLVSCRNKNSFQYINGQIGYTTKNKNVSVDDVSTDTYITTSKQIFINFETMNMNENFDNYIRINDNHSINIIPSSNQQNDFVKNRVEILGQNIVDGKLKITFNVGKNNKDILDTFWVRNVNVEIGNNKFFSNEDKNLSYSRVVKLGNKALKSKLRDDYVESSDFNFEIDKKLLKNRGIIIKNNNESININGDEIKNLSYIEIDSSIDKGEKITEDKILDVQVQGEGISSLLYLNGVEIENNLRLNKNSWSSGKNKLEIVAKNKYGFVTKDTIEFELESFVFENKSKYTAYDSGVTTLSNDVYLGKKVDVVENYKSDFSEYSQINLVFDENESKSIIWQGTTLKNRSIYLQIYNNTTKKWDTKSTMFSENEEIITLGYNYKNESNYVSNGKINIRIVSKNNTKINLIDKYIYHLSDVQYISRNGSIENSNISEYAKNSFKEMSDHLIKMYDDNLLEYVAMTGDFVQSTVKTGVKEWPVVMNNLINPLLDNGIPIGTVSGNHDIGALNENTPEGVDTLDDLLIYDLYSQNLGEDVFKDKPYYGGSFENNRSHFDLITINGHEFLFLYLGWGSSIKGIHVSEKDIEYAKTILEMYPNKTVVIGVHEYMKNRDVKTGTGIYIYNELVEKYSNIKFVLSGHVNGSSGKIDYLDDNNDGINDRRVFQLLTNFQEEAIENLGATFMRRIGLDFTNNRMNFDIYSPIANDYQIFVNENADYVKKYSDFTYDFDLGNNDYGFITHKIGG